MWVFSMMFYLYWYIIDMILLNICDDFGAVNTYWPGPTFSATESMINIRSCLSRACPTGF